MSPSIHAILNREGEPLGEPERVKDLLRCIQSARWTSKSCAHATFHNPIVSVMAIFRQLTQTIRHQPTVLSSAALFAYNHICCASLVLLHGRLSRSKRTGSLFR